MDAMEVIRARRSIRTYQATPVNRELLNRLVEAATLAPNAMNEQAWSFTIVTDRQLLLDISHSAKAHLLVDLAQGPHIDHMRSTLSDPRFEIFHGAPALIVISAPKHLQWAVEDCALAAENLMLAAQAQGIGTCWIGFAQTWLNTPEGRAAIHLEDALLAVAPIIVGYPKETPAAVPRRTPQVHWIE